MKTKILASVVLLASALFAQPIQASPLSDLVEQQQVEWLLGSWTSTDGNVKLSYEYRVEKNIIGVKFKGGDREAEGMIALKPGTNESVYVAVDNRGAISKGTWSEHDGNPLLKTTVTGEQGEMKLASEHIKVDADTMRVKVYKQDEAGEPGELLIELEMKRGN
jgi:hypothetical protein